MDLSDDTDVQYPPMMVMIIVSITKEANKRVTMALLSQSQGNQYHLVSMILEPKGDRKEL